MKVEPDQVLELYFIYLSSIFGEKRVKQILQILKENDSELALKLSGKRESIENFIVTQKDLSEDKIRDNIKNLEEEDQTLVIYRLLREGLLKSLNFNRLKANSLKNFVFNLEGKWKRKVL